MKKVAILSTVLFIVSFAAQAQPDFSDFRIDVGANYTMYKGDFDKSTPGVKVRGSVPLSEKFILGLGFTYGLPIKESATAETDMGTDIPSEWSTNFKTISLEADYMFGGEKEEGLTVYGSLRMGLVLANQKEKLKGNVPPGEEYTTEKFNENGFTIGGGLGTQYALGSMKIFGDAAIALPANKVNDQYVVNFIPAHFTFNLGVRFSLGGGE